MTWFCRLLTLVPNGSAWELDVASWELTVSTRISHPCRHPIDGHQQGPSEVNHIRIVRIRTLRSHLAESAQQLDLDDVDRVDIRVADVDRAPQHRIFFEQSGVAGDLEHGVRGAGEPRPELAAEVVKVGTDE